MSNPNKIVFHNHQIEIEKDNATRMLRWIYFINEEYMGCFENCERSQALDKAKQAVLKREHDDIRIDR